MNEFKNSVNLLALLTSVQVTMGVPRSSLLRLAVTVGWAAQAWGKIPMPFEYRGFDNFPASFFGADIHGVEADSEMALVAKHQVGSFKRRPGTPFICSGALNRSSILRALTQHPFGDLLSCSSGKCKVSGWGWQQGCMASCCPPPHCNCETSNPVS